MKFEWDENKNKINKIKHGLDFAALDQFSWDDAVIVPDERYSYGEMRFLAYGFLKKRLHIVVFTHRGENIRIIGARKANAREKELYDEKIAKAKTYH